MHKNKNMNKVKTSLISKIFSTVTSVAVLSSSILPASLALATPVHANAALSITNVVDSNLADRGEILNYTVTVKNTGTVTSTNTIIGINPPNLSSLVSGSINYLRTETGVTKNLSDSFLTTGGNFGSVPVGKEIIIQVKPDVVAKAWTRVILKNPSLCAKKTADKEVYAPGDTVHYTVEICNNGN